MPGLRDRGPSPQGSRSLPPPVQAPSPPGLKAPPLPLPATLTQPCSLTARLLPAARGLSSAVSPAHSPTDGLQRGRSRPGCPLLENNLCQTSLGKATAPPPVSLGGESHLQTWKAESQGEASGRPHFRGPAQPTSPKGPSPVAERGGGPHGVQRSESVSDSPSAM